jgi:hypothetical protein
MGHRKVMMITSSKDEECDLKIMYRNEDFECQYTLWLVNFIWTLFGNTGSWFYNPRTKHDSVSFICGNKRLTDYVESFPDPWSKNIALLKIWDFPPKYLYLGDGFEMLVLWRCRQQILPQCWYPDDIGRKFFHNAVPLKIQIEDFSKLLVPQKWRQWIPPKCWQLEDGGSEFLQNVGPHSAKTWYCNSQICISFLTLTHPQIWCPS